MKILKAGQTGHGLLIENDAGYISKDLNPTIVREFTELNINDKNNKVIVFAVLQKYGVENRNGRIYTKEILERENKRYQELIKTRSSVGELNHPESSVVDGERVSHIITETWWEGRTLMGKLELDTTLGFHKFGIVSTVGDKVANMLRQGFTIGISSRGVGSLKQEGGKNVVQDDFELICWDVVTSPSTPGSWIASNESELKPYKESVEPKTTITEGGILDTLNKFLKD